MKIKAGKVKILRTPFAEIIISAGVNRVDGKVADVVCVRRFQNVEASISFQKWSHHSVSVTVKSK